MPIKPILILAIVASVALLTGCNTPAPRVSADTIYTGGNIITINDASPSAEALAVKDGKILAVGAETDVFKTKGVATKVVNLNGKTLLPGFIDSWSHIGGAVLLAKFADLSFWGVDAPANFAGIFAKLEENRKERSVKDGEWIVGWGYDPTYLKEDRHPNRADLDAAFPNNPVALVHLSGIMGVTNSAGLKILGITTASKDPVGGSIVRNPKTQEPTGLLQGTSFAPLVLQAVGKPTMEQMRQGLRKTQLIYAANGFTTVQDGISLPSALALYEEAGANGELILDIVALPGSEMADALISGKNAMPFGVYKNHWKLGGIVMSGDSGPQERTALFSQPYLTRVQGKEADFRGMALSTQEEINRIAKLCYTHNIQYIGYGNGDGGIDMHLNGIAKAVHELKDPGQDHRAVIAHSQFVRRDQLDAYKKYGIIPSFFTNHAYMFGDVHVVNLGKDRAFFLSPMKTAAAKGLVVTNHTDYFSAPPAALFAMWTSVNRLSRSDVVIGSEERVTPLDALRAMTANGAYQYFEEKTKGSLEVGKLADFVIVDTNPLTVDPMKIKDIQVVETIKEGKTIYVAP
jgi:predicted amidohydrolase YtcJ